MGAEQVECPAFIDLLQSCLKLEEWEVSNFISEQYLRLQHPRLSGLWPQHQLLLMLRLDSDPNTAMFVADPADSCQQDSCQPHQS